MNCFYENMKLLKKSSPLLHSTVKTEQPLEGAFIEVHRQGGKDNIFVKNERAACWIHSVYDMERELDCMFADVRQDTQVLVIFGLGLGYSMPYIIKKYPKIEHIYVIEPNVDLFKAFLSGNDLKTLFNLSAKVTFIINRPAVDALTILPSMLVDQVYNRIGFVYNVAYRTLFHSYFEEFHDGLKVFFREMLVSTVTKNKYRYVWTANHWKNLKQYKMPVQEVFSQLQDVPAIIVGAGPSLNKNIHLLKEVKNRALIVAVGSSMTILEKNGIIPDFRIAVEGWKSNTELFAQVDTSRCPLICSNNLYYKIQQIYQNAMIEMVTSSEKMTQYLYDRADLPYQVVFSGFSVANSTLDLLCKMGCPKIIFMGQDLCYTDNQLHAAGSWREGKKGPQGHIPATDIFNRPVLTDKPFLGMKKQLEEIITGYSNIEFINATEGGLHIAGTENKSFVNVMHEDLQKTFAIDQILNNLAYDPVKEKVYHTQLGQVIDDVYLEVEGILDVVENTLTRLKTIRTDLQMEKSLVVKLHELQLVNCSLEEDLKQIPFYVDVVYKMLSDVLESIKSGFSTKNEPVEQKVMMLERQIVGQLVEVKQYTEFVKVLIEDYKGIRNFEVVFE